MAVQQVRMSEVCRQIVSDSRSRWRLCRQSWCASDWSEARIKKLFFAHSKTTAIC